jgi:glycerol-3-phosphate acyltransferase PlsY
LESGHFRVIGSWNLVIDTIWQSITLVIGSYLLGSAPVLAALARISGVQISGDYHISLWGEAGRAVGLLGIVLDAAKGALPILAGTLLRLDIAIITLAGLAAVTGQMWPVFSRFNGEKGNTPGVAMAASLAILPCAIGAIAWAIAAAMKTLPRLWKKRSLNEWTRFGGPVSNCLPIGMIVGFFIIPFASAAFKEPPVVTAGFAVLFILLIVRRVTAGLAADLKGAGSAWGIIFNRMLLDRSHR